MILAIDSGKRTGWALFDGYLPESTAWRLIAAGAITVDRDLRSAPWLLVGTTGPHRGRAIIEKPEGRGGKTKASPDSLIALAVRAGKVAGALEVDGIPITFVTPVKWKGSLSKAVCHRQLAAVLTPAELAVLKGVKSKDAWDAVGVGLWALGRY